MRARWTWGLVLAMCVLPASAQARERGHDGRARERHPSAGQHADRGGERPSARAERSDRGDRHERGRNRERSYGRDTGRRPDSRRDDRSAARGSRQSWTGGGRGSRPAWSGSDRGHRDDRSWRGSYRAAPRRVWPTHRYRPRYPAYYRYGYVHRHGYYFPRYYFDYGFYPAHGSIRIQVEPDVAEVYVDGYYAGIVDDFDGLFQRLDVAPGPHEITLRLDGFRTWSNQVYAVPGETVNLRFEMLPGPSGDEPGAYYDRDDDAGAYGVPQPYER
jgi:hypothetical protein